MKLPSRLLFFVWVGQSTASFVMVVEAYVCAEHNHATLSIERYLFSFGGFFSFANQSHNYELNKLVSKKQACKYVTFSFSFKAIRLTPVFLYRIQLDQGYQE